MRIRRLERSEHEQTRELYEQVFAEDSKEFVDYYYTWKTKDNIIYAAEDEDGIHAMVHLNPFLLSVNGKIQSVHYIVAVATQKEYRHQGLMRRLLCLAEQEMAQCGEEFTFLMPASEKIYRPFGYRFFAWQRKGILRAEGWSGRSADFGKRQVLAAEVQKDTAEQEQRASAAFFRPVMPQEYGALARFVNDILDKQYDVFVYRDAAYYERLCAEQQCQGGEVMVIMQREIVIGTFCTAQEEPDSEYAVEIREVIFAEDMQKEALGALQEYVNGCGSCRVAGYQVPIEPEQEVFGPLLMGKAPEGGVFSSPWDAERVFINEVV